MITWNRYIIMLKRAALCYCLVLITSIASAKPIIEFDAQTPALTQKLGYMVASLVMAIWRCCP